ncbi:MAG: response regulator [Caulobacteraceae bacterium]|nr:response regulator [Caulobacteraceae bacterium]
MANTPRPPPNARINLDKLNVLLVDDNQQSLDILSQVLSGFGVRSMHKCDSGEEALKLVQRMSFDFIMTDGSMPGMDGYELTQAIRRLQGQPNAYVPILLVTGHARQSQVFKARDCGANFVVAKPITPRVLLDRIFWVAKEDRMFVETDTYVGPDRRFKREGPPAGVTGRRKDDLTTELGTATTPNLSQDQIDGLVKPMKVNI